MLRRFLLAALVAGLLASTTHAQSVTMVIDLAPYGLAGAEVLPADADGNPATVEYLAKSGDLYQVVAVRSVVCQGAWFNPKALVGVPAWASVATATKQGRTVLVVRSPWDSILREVGLHLPPCW
jgi:hypothetical protein